MISISGVRKRFGDHEALAGVDLEVPQGTVQGLLGPNGAGKTTTVRVLTTLLDPDEGEAYVAGHSVRTHGDRVRRNLGLSGQYAAVDERLTGFENLVLVGELYGMKRRAPGSARANCCASSASTMCRAPSGPERIRAGCDVDSTSPARSWRDHRS